MTNQTQNDLNLPGWLKNLIWILTVFASLVVYHNTVVSDLKAEDASLEKENAVLKNEIEHLKQEYSDGLKKIVDNTDEIMRKLNASK